MVTNVYISCDTCKTKFRLRWQVDDYKTPVMIRCPKCNTKIRGTLQCGRDGYSFTNALIDDEINSADYVQEVSALFITHKLTPSAKFTEVITPFIRSNYDERHQKFLRYLTFIDSYPNEVEKIHDLFNAKSISYLKTKLKDENNCYITTCKQAIKKYRLNSDADILMASHQYIFVTLMESGATLPGTDHLMMDLSDLRKFKSDQMKEFSKLMDVNNYYAHLNNKFPILVELFNKNYISLISTLILGGVEKVDLEEYGLSSVDYEDLLELYRKSYEFIGEFIIYIIGLNNIHERGDYNSFKNGISDLEEKINREDKYNRIQSFVRPDEKYSKGYCDTLNKIVRNAEAHFDVAYDIFTQKITFTNHGKKETQTHEMYLLELAEETIKIFGLAIELWEIAYQLQKMRMIIDLGVEWSFGRH